MMLKQIMLSLSMEHYQMTTFIADDLTPISHNKGVIDIASLIAGKEQPLLEEKAGSFSVFRVGDAVASRNIHVAILDARLCQTI